MVYRTLQQGSSPLARGARRRSSGRALSPRVIPARAGSVTRPGYHAQFAAGHSRSRGKCGSSVSRSSSSCGSSPLARGSAARLVHCDRPAGVHPRPRGERGDRQFAAFSAAAGPGPSPLARGARSSADQTPSVERSIPARAESVIARSVGTSSSAGSSPLARGARMDLDRVRGDRRAIPARAGSAPSSPPAGRIPAGHPRSRGERDCLRPYGSPGDGPSPLARGAPLFRGPWAGPWGHPRSRGERWAKLTTQSLAAGPSPLARGALTMGADALAHGRAIPARAGSAQTF
jgi:hypothetical protein